MVGQPSAAEEVAGQIKEELLWHVAQPQLDFTDSNRWCPGRFGDSYHPAYQISAWLRKLLYGFEYARIAAPDVWTPHEEQGFLEWLHAAARWYLPQIDFRRVGMWDPDGAPSRAAEGWGGLDSRPVFAGGPRTRRVQHQYNNHVNRYVVFVTDVGIVTGDESMKEYGRRWIREFLEVCVYPQGAISDFYRWDDPKRGHTQGWKYGVYMVGATMVIADHLARSGDASGYLHATTGGTRDTRGSVPDDGITEGGPKTLLTAARQMARYVDERSEPPRYASFRGRPDRLISSRDTGRGIVRTDDWVLLQGNVFYRDPYLQAIHLRALPGTPGLPERLHHSLGWIENGDAGTFPGVNFMFAQMAGRVWPYPSGGEPPPAADEEAP
jgi:hypothetical protein